MSESLVELRQDGPLLYVELNRPDKRNAINLELLEQLAAAVASADQIPEARAVIVSGKGKLFSAGIDLMMLASGRANAGELHFARWLRREAETMQHHLHIIEQTEVPVIGAIHGGAYGLGVEIACAFDFRVLADNAVLNLPEARLGLIADVGGTTRLTKLIGPSRTKDMLMTARDIYADEALMWGLVNRVVPEEQLMDEATALANQIVANAPLAVGLAKFVVDQGDGVDRYTQMAISRLAQSQLVMSEDCMEAAAAFMEKRAPEWKSR